MVGVVVIFFSIDFFFVVFYEDGLWGFSFVGLCVWYYRESVRLEFIFMYWFFFLFLFSEGFGVVCFVV